MAYVSRFRQLFCTNKSPYSSRVPIRIRCAASNCGAMIVASTKALTLVGTEEDEEDGKEGGVGGGRESPLDYAAQRHN